MFSARPSGFSSIRAHAARSLPITSAPFTPRILATRTAAEKATGGVPVPREPSYLKNEANCARSACTPIRARGVQLTAAARFPVSVPTRSDSVPPSIGKRPPPRCSQLLPAGTRLSGDRYRNLNFDRRSRNSGRNFVLLESRRIVRGFETLRLFPMR